MIENYSYDRFDVVNLPIYDYEGKIAGIVKRQIITEPFKINFRDEEYDECWAVIMDDLEAIPIEKLLDMIEDAYEWGE